MSSCELDETPFQSTVVAYWISWAALAAWPTRRFAIVIDQYLMTAPEAKILKGNVIIVTSQ